MSSTTPLITYLNYLKVNDLTLFNSLDFNYLLSFSKNLTTDFILENLDQNWNWSWLCYH